jgi:hypothetical protein
MIGAIFQEASISKFPEKLVCVPWVALVAGFVERNWLMTTMQLPILSLAGGVIDYRKTVIAR